MKSKRNIRGISIWAARERCIAGLAIAVLGFSGLAPVASAAPAAPSLTSAASTSDRMSELSQSSSEVPPDDRDELLGSKWETSADTVVAAAGDAYAFNIYKANASNGYAWSRVASLRVAGVETDRWIGNTCLSEDGAKAAVVYAPRTLTNDEQMFNRGAFGAIVDLNSGTVTDLGLGFSIAYFSPGCGSGNSAVFTSFSDIGETKLQTFDMTTAADPFVRVSAVQVTSAIPTDSGIFAAADGALVRVEDDGALTTIESTTGTPFDLTALHDQIAFIDPSGDEANVRLRSLVGDEAGSTIYSSGISEVGISPRIAQAATLVGPEVLEQLPENIDSVTATVGSVVSSNSELAVEAISPKPEAADGSFDVTAGDAPVAIEAKSLLSGANLEFLIDPGASSASVFESDLLAEPTSSRMTNTAELNVSNTVLSAATGSSTNPVETERTCAVARNDPGSQAMQPKPRQVEWAVNRAVLGQLTVSRAAGYLNVSSTTSYTPQGLFPRTALTGGGRVPSQVMLGIIAQESNLWQASRYAVPGVTGNPLIGNFYGLTDRDTPSNWSVDFAKADCGYGVSQVTDGMRLAGSESNGVPAMSTIKQRAVALDYAANVAAGLQILSEKWNQTKAANLTVNNGDPAYLENWFFAVWAYNSGFYPRSGSEPWGVGWLNNPVNPNYPANRTPFLQDHPEHAASPQNWPYPEKVMGFAAWSFEALESVQPDGELVYVPAFRPAWWSSVTDRTAVKPPRTLFCNTTNNCDATKSVQPNAPGVSTDPSGPCLHKNSAGQYDLKCWFNQPVEWKGDCTSMCGNELLRFDSTYMSEQPFANSFPANCSKAATDSGNPMSRGLPSGTVYVIDNVPSGTKEFRDGCTPQTTQGSFGFTFASAANGTYPSKVDLHQLGAGFNGQFYFSHSRSFGGDGEVDPTLTISGKWTLNTSLNQWGRVLVHMPDHGAQTQQAQYQVGLGNGVTKTRSVGQRTYANSWVALGTFKFAGTPTVTLSNRTHDGDGYDDIAWDAIAIQPLAAKPTDFVVAMGDSFSSGEGASVNHGESYYPESDNNGDVELPGATTFYNMANDNVDLKYNRERNACHRSTEAWSRKAKLPSSTQTIGQRADAFAANMDYHLIACSGAETENILPYFTASFPGAKPTNGWGQDGRYGKFREDSQLDRGFLDENTTLVTMTIGGNDARFSKVLLACIPNMDCANTILPGETKKLPAAQQDLIPQLRLSLERVFKETAAKAPNAKILVQGYPMLFEQGTTCINVLTSQRTWLNAFSTTLNSTISSAVSSTNSALSTNRIIYSNAQTKFSGHNLCSDVEDQRQNASTPARYGQSAINGLIFTDSTKGDGVNLKQMLYEQNLLYPSAQSIHPNKYGTDLYAQAMTERLIGSYP
ncbi:hypothetical protein [Rathayibacter sp. AY1A7]|uniref:golvesin C-terminal-like domain-containing protein n=1 Tax=Rathayibacter sp. AY1A7 TaxID=2080524 RepID=UPI000CE7EF57|nr:hypothetical protein [Rathayibacter sp. AY1A7]PPF20898.1 hypothetical protein C5B95_07325 [Rathayibacter sp. AY1A7]